MCRREPILHHIVEFEDVVLLTGAWIITGGTHAGVMKHVGQAVKDHALSSSSSQGQIVAIGVATWGVIHNRDALVNAEVWRTHIHVAFLSRDPRYVLFYRIDSSCDIISFLLCHQLHCRVVTQPII